ncbi:MAG: hypothetical protein ACLVL7_03345 [Anaerotruncus massiliensis (ex Togo et al. 2019)]
MDKAAALKVYEAAQEADAQARAKGAGGLRGRPAGIRAGQAVREGRL